MLKLEKSPYLLRVSNAAAIITTRLPLTTLGWWFGMSRAKVCDQNKEIHAKAISATHPIQPTLPTYSSSILGPPSLKRRLASSKADLSGMPRTPIGSDTFTWHDGKERFTWHTQQTSLLAVRLALSALAEASHFVSVGAACCCLLQEATELCAVVLVLLLAIGWSRDREQWGCGLIRNSGMDPRGG
jgi:hypothetical protein